MLDSLEIEVTGPSMIYLDQEQYISIILNKFGFTNEKHSPVDTPATGYDNLRPTSGLDKRINILEYQQAVGIVMNAMIFSRPDISFVLDS